MTWREIVYMMLVMVLLLTWRLNEIDKQETKRMKIKIHREGIAATRELSASLNRASTLFEIGR